MIIFIVANIKTNFVITHSKCLVLGNQFFTKLVSRWFYPSSIYICTKMLWSFYISAFNIWRYFKIYQEVQNNSMGPRYPKWDPDKHAGENLNPLPHSLRSTKLMPTQAKYTTMKMLFDVMLMSFIPAKIRLHSGIRGGDLPLLLHRFRCEL